MKLTEEQWESIADKLAPKMSADDIKKVLSDLSYDYDDEDIEDILVGIGVDSSNEPNADNTPDDPDESSEKPHDEELAGKEAPKENYSGILPGDLTPEEIEMIKMMRAKKQASENTDNITNRLAKNLSKHRW